MKLADIQRSTIARGLLLTALYTVALTVSLWAAYLLRFDFNVAEFPPKIDQRDKMAVIRMYFLWIIPMKLAVLLSFRQFEGLLSYFSLPDLRRLFSATTISSVVILLVY